MSEVIVMNQSCRRTLLRLDEYVDNQLTDKEAAELVSHLQGCSSCFEELELRRRLSTRLKSAVSSSPSPSLHTRVLAGVRSEADKQAGIWYTWRRQLTGVAALLTVCLTFGSVAYHLGSFRFTAESRERYIASISQQVSWIMAVGLGDHVHCTVFRKVPEKAPALDQVVNELPPEYKELMKVVTDKIPAGYDLFTAHACRYHKRRFYHLAMKHGDRLVSLIITRRQSGEVFPAQDAVDALSKEGIQVYSAGVQRYQISGFETRDHLAWIVSDAGKPDSDRLMLALAPAVSGYLKKLES